MVSTATPSASPRPGAAYWLLVLLGAALAAPLAAVLVFAIALGWLVIGCTFFDRCLT